MRKIVRIGAIGLTTVALVAALPIAAASAAQGARGDLKVCVEAITDEEGDSIGVEEVEVSADGPSFREEDLEEGDCKRWQDVRKGQYYIDVEPADGEPFETCFIERAEIKRTGEDAIVRYGSFFGGGSPIVTNVAKNRTTKVTLFVSCFENFN